MEENYMAYDPNDPIYWSEEEMWEIAEKLEENK